MMVKIFTANSNPAEHAVYWVKDLQIRHKIAETVECASGCHHCCHQIVSITVFEALRLAKGLEELSESNRKLIQSNAALNVDANNKAKTDTDRWKLRLPCSLLIDKRCSAYEHRPIACIATTSMSRAHCIEQFDNENSPQHKVLSIAIDELSIESMLNYQITLAINNNADLAKLMSPAIRKALIIDLDRFVHFYCVPDREERERRVDKLIQLDAGTLAKLEKQTE